MGKKSQSSTTTKIYGNTTTTNPYATASTNNSGTVAKFNDGTALNSIYNFVNKNMNSLLDEYLNPNLNSATNQAKLNSFTNTLNTESRKNLENNIINPLSSRNMVRSSQATDLYKNLSDSNTNALASYVNELISASQENSAKVINNLLSAYMQGYDVISDMQKQSLNTSSGNSTVNSSSNSSTGAGGAADTSGQFLSLISKLAQMFVNK